MLLFCVKVKYYADISNRYSCFIQWFSILSFLIHIVSYAFDDYDFFLSLYLVIYFLLFVWIKWFDMCLIEFDTI